MNLSQACFILVFSKYFKNLFDGNIDIVPKTRKAELTDNFFKSKEQWSRFYFLQLFPSLIFFNTMYIYCVFVCEHTYYV